MLVRWTWSPNPNPLCWRASRFLRPPTRTARHWCNLCTIIREKRKGKKNITKPWGIQLIIRDVLHVPWVNSFVEPFCCWNSGKLTWFCLPSYRIEIDKWKVRDVKLNMTNGRDVDRSLLWVTFCCACDDACAPPPSVEYSCAFCNWPVSRDRDRSLRVDCSSNADAGWVT